MKKTLGIDPGSEKSALLLCQNNEPLVWQISPNADILREFNRQIAFTDVDILLIEQIQCYGMPVGKTVLDTVFWSGRFVEAWRGDYELIPRREVKLHFCGSARAKDSNIRQCLIDRFGAPGTKKNPNPITYHIKKDLWQAFAMIVFYNDIRRKYEKKRKETENNRH